LALIDIGDLDLSTTSSIKHGTKRLNKQERLQQAIRDKIVQGLWVQGGKLPSTRKLSQDLSLSRNTVINTYEQLVAEGYLESRQGSGFFVVPKLPDAFLYAEGTPSARLAKASCSDRTQKHILPNQDLNQPFSPGVPDLVQFPHAQWQRLMARHSGRPHLMGSQDLQGLPQLRHALADYLLGSRSVRSDASRIIITQGAQQALTIALMATMEHRDDVVAFEDPGYSNLRKIVTLMAYASDAIPVTPKQGLNIDRVLTSPAKALYITPSNQYPLGTTLTTEQRLQLIEWANTHQRWIIEDDYDSEFQFSHRPYSSLQGLSAQLGEQQRVLYVGSFSKIMFNSLRLGYLVVPDALFSRCLAIKEALAGNTTCHSQAALADFIVEGGLIRHIRKMRRLYTTKFKAMQASIAAYFGSDMAVISQAAGLHVTLKWTGMLDEELWAERALAKGIVIRPMSYYESNNAQHRDWNGAVLGFGNVATERIDESIKLLADCFYFQPIE
jgi:GntR family transcriptional regulator/MocR family aminotransferase